MAKSESSGGSSGKQSSSGTDASRASDPPIPAADLHIWQIQAVRDVLFVAAVIGVVWVGYALRAVTVPLLVALLLAYLFEPVIQRLCENPKLTRVRAVSLVLALAGAVVIGLLALGTPLAIGQTSRLVEDFKGGGTRASLARIGEKIIPGTFHDEMNAVLRQLPGAAVIDGVDDVSDGASDGGSDDEGSVDSASSDGPVTLTGLPDPVEAAEAEAEELERLIDERIAAALEVREAADEAAITENTSMTSWWGVVKTTIAFVLAIIGRVVQVGLVSFLVPFYFFFFSLWYQDVIKFGRGLIPEKNKDTWIEMAGKMDAVVAGFVRGRIVISLIMGVMLAIGWMICGVPYSIVLGLTVGVFCAIPYLGGVGIPLAIALLMLDQYKGEPTMPMWLMFIGPSAVFFVVQAIEGWVLTPMIAGKATNLDPVTILVAVLAGGSVLGVYGMILAIPLAACGKIMAADLLMPRIRAWTRGEVKDPLPIDR